MTTVIAGVVVRSAPKTSACSRRFHLNRDFSRIVRRVIVINEKAFILPATMITNQRKPVCFLTSIYTHFIVIIM